MIVLTSRLTHTRRFQQVRVNGRLRECGGGREAGQLVDGRGRAGCRGGARAAHVGTEKISFKCKQIKARQVNSATSLKTDIFSLADFKV